MKRLFRNSLYSEQKSHDVRINQVERRFVDVPTHWAMVNFAVTPQSVSSGGTILTWENFRTTNDLVFSTSATAGGAISNTAGDAAIRCDSTGVFLVTGWVVFESGTFQRKIAVNVGGGETDAITNFADIQTSTASAGATDVNGFTVAQNDEQWFQAGVDGFPSWFTIQANVIGANKNAVSGSLTAILFRPSGVEWDDTVIY